MTLIFISAYYMSPLATSATLREVKMVKLFSHLIKSHAMKAYRE
jgi:hypothetical protein